jgi:hypothetical protein
MTDLSGGPTAQEGSPDTSDHEKPDVRPDGGEQGDSRPPRGFLRRLDTNQWLTLLVGVGSLVIGAGSLAVAFMAYRNAADTSDIKNAIGNLSELATQTKRQADATHDQLGAVKDQVSALRDQAEEAKRQTAAIAKQTEAIKASSDAAVRVQSNAI